jgi:hypothetical protein
MQFYFGEYVSIRASENADSSIQAWHFILLTRTDASFCSNKCPPPPPPAGLASKDRIKLWEITQIAHLLLHVRALLCFAERKTLKHRMSLFPHQQMATGVIIYRDYYQKFTAEKGMSNMKNNG